MNTQIAACPRAQNIRILMRLRRHRQIRYKNLGREALRRLRQTWTNSELPIWQGFSITRF